MKKTDGFDVTLAKNCARSFATTSSLGTVVSLSTGETLAAYGTYNCDSCQLCRIIGRERSLCVSAHIYGMNEAERFGGKYVYFCPLGLTCFTSPIVGDNGTEAKITVGPFLMEDSEEYLLGELMAQLPPGVSVEELRSELRRVPVVAAGRVEDMSNLMFLSVGFLNKVWAAAHMMDIQDSYSIQKQITSYMISLKENIQRPPYPFFIERELLDCIAHMDRDGARRHLNEILGYIIFTIGGDVQQAKSRVYELLVLISRTAASSGADAQTMLTLTHDYIQIIPGLNTMDELCAWLAKVMNRFMDAIFEYTDLKHANVIYKAIQYIHAHYMEKISLEQVAQAVFLSPAYFSRVFRQETGETFSAYLNAVRVEQSKKLLLDKSARLIDIALMSGFESQSYFTKVFKKKTGMSPLQYRERSFQGYPAGLQLPAQKNKK